MKDGQSTIVLAGFTAESAQQIVVYLSDHYLVLTADTPLQVLERVSKQAVDIILCRHATPAFDAIHLFSELRISHPRVIRVIGGHMTDVDVELAMKRAAVYQFFPEDSKPEQLDLLVRRALENRELAHRHRHLNRQLKIAEDLVRGHPAKKRDDGIGGYHFDELVYANQEMATLCSDARKAAGTELPVLVQGETGTGKELITRAIHFHSRRKAQPLMIQNCGGISDDLLQSELFGHKRGAYTGAVSDRLGLFPAADGGTVFLDEISEVSPAFQVSLLRFLQDGEVKPLGSDVTIKCDVRIIAACNRSLEELVKAGKFRQDLFYRLNGFQLKIPPLRKRKDEIRILSEYLAKRYSDSVRQAIIGVSEQVISKFELYDWPGNVRELENEIKRMVALSEHGTYVTEDKLAPHIANLQPVEKAEVIDWTQTDASLKEKVEMLESQLVADALTRYRWNQSRAAEHLGLSRVGLANKIKRYGLNGGGKAA